MSEERRHGAVSAAKAALESHTRQLALELGSRGILVNCINAGVTDTSALRAIPGNEIMIAETLRRSPQHRLTTTEDVAATIVALSQPEIKFISMSKTQKLGIIRSSSSAAGHASPGPSCGSVCDRSDDPCLVCHLE